MSSLFAVMEPAAAPSRPALSPRPYQLRAVDALRREVEAGRTRVILSAPTGSGKTFIAAMLIRGAVAKGKRALFLAPARRLVQQCCDALTEAGLGFGIVMAGHGYQLAAPIQVGSVDTVFSRAVRNPWLDLGAPDLVIEDECHHFLAPTRRRLMELFPKSVHVGLSATPCTASGRGLGAAYQGIVQAATYAELTEAGYLVPARVFAPHVPDLKGVRKDHDGNYNETEVLRRMDRLEVVGDAVRHWKALAGDRPTIVFCVNVRHSLHVRDEYRARGIAAEHVDGTTEDAQRDEFYGRLCDGKIAVLTSCNVLTEGVDLPPVACGQNLAPTGSFVKHHQRIGRLLRPFPGKAEAKLIDHAGDTFRHGPPGLDVDYTLEETDRVSERVRESLAEGKPRQPITCPDCYAVYSGLPACPNCGRTTQRQAQGRKVKPGLLVELDPEKAAPVVRQEQEQRAWLRFLAIAYHRGQPAKVAAAMFRREFGHGPAEPLGPLPGDNDWQRPVHELYPSFGRRKATVAG